MFNGALNACNVNCKKSVQEIRLVFNISLPGNVMAGHPGLLCNRILREICSNTIVNTDRHTHAIAGRNRPFRCAIFTLNSV